MPLTNDLDRHDLPLAKDVIKAPLKVAFLGPRGTYSHQAAFDRFGNEVEYMEKDTIADTLNAVPLEASIAVIPAENSIFGPVIETLDLLRLPEVGEKKVVAGEVVFQVQHCLLAVRGTNLGDIRSVLSHEQALGQCSNFLKTRLPDALVVKTTSTAAAAEAILADETRNNSAAICSEVCSSVYPDLTVLETAIQNEGNNFTRFWIVTDSSIIPSLVSTKKHCALLRVSEESSHEQPSDLSLLIARLKLGIQTIDRRPSTQGIPFRDVYYFRVSRHPSQDILAEDTSSWVEEVDHALERVRTLGWKACVLGIW